MHFKVWIRTTDEAVADAARVSIRVVRHARKAGAYDPQNLRSVAFWIASKRNAVLASKLAGPKEAT